MTPVAIITIIAMRALRPWILVRVGKIRAEKIGHFVMDAALHLAAQSFRSGRPVIFDCFYVARRTSNEQWARMVRRQLHVHWWVRYLIVFNQLIPGGELHQVGSVNGSRDVYGLFHQMGVHFEFSVDEMNRAKSWLIKHGWDEKAPFVCLLSRDSKFNALEGGKDWSYHDYRNTEIDAYTTCIENLVAKGYWVIRMGKNMHRELSYRHPHVIDYPFVDDQDDLIDVWLSANCQFFISTGSGIDSIPDVYGVPTVYVNFIPFQWMRTYSNIIIVPKYLIWKDTGKYLTFRECLDHSYLHTEKYVSAGIEIQDLSDEEINMVVNEMERRIDNTWVDTAGDIERQEKFWKTFKSHPDYGQHHNWIHPQARVGMQWLKSMGDEFLL